MADARRQVEVDLPYLTVYKDGSVRRKEAQPLVPPSPDPGPGQVASKDITINAALGLWARMFIPCFLTSSEDRRLPIVLYFHGGGFVFGSPAWPSLHSFCERMAARSRSIWISATYRLGPEHRLPAPLEDGFSTLKWLHLQALLQAEHKDELLDPWLVQADFSKCLFGGVSSGGILAHHVVSTALNKPLSSASWQPLRIAGLILIHPGFMRSKKTQEELASLQDVLMSWDLAEKCLRLVLPVGSSLDDYFNPLPALAAAGRALVLPKTLVMIAEKDPLLFMEFEYVHALKDAGCHVDTVVQSDVGHVFFIAQPDSEKTNEMMHIMTNFMTALDKES